MLHHTRPSSFTCPTPNHHGGIRNPSTLYNYYPRDTLVSTRNKVSQSRISHNSSTCVTWRSQMQPPFLASSSLIATMSTYHREIHTSLFGSSATAWNPSSTVRLQAPSAKKKATRNPHIAHTLHRKRRYCKAHKTPQAPISNGCTTTHKIKPIDIPNKRQGSDRPAA